MEKKRVSPLRKGLFSEVPVPGTRGKVEYHEDWGD